MNTANLSAIYSKAFLHVVYKNDLLDIVRGDMNLLSDVFNMAPELMEKLCSPGISVSQRRRVVKRTFEGKIHRLTMNFLNVVLKRNRHELLKYLPKSFEAEVTNNIGIEDAYLTSAKSIDKIQYNRIKEKLERRFYKRINLHTNIDSSMLGGFKIRIGNELMDYTIKNNLDRLRKHLI